MARTPWEQISILLFTIFFEFTKGRTLESSTEFTTLPPLIWPTVESGLLLLRPYKCAPELHNCSSHGACALHGQRPVCLCVLGYHGDYCENKTSPVPPLHVASLLISILIIYMIIHAACVLHRSRCQRLRARSISPRKLTSYGSIEQDPAKKSGGIFIDNRKICHNATNDETQTTTPTGTLSR